MSDYKRTYAFHKPIGSMSSIEVGPGWQVEETPRGLVITQMNTAPRRRWNVPWANVAYDLEFGEALSVEKKKPAKGE